jgi:hypothetical protein
LPTKATECVKFNRNWAILGRNRSTCHLRSPRYVQADLLPCFVAVQPANWCDSGRFTSALRWQKSPLNVIEITIGGRSVARGDSCGDCPRRVAWCSQAWCSLGSFRMRLGLIEGSDSQHHDAVASRDHSDVHRGNPGIPFWEPMRHVAASPTVRGTQDIVAPWAPLIPFRPCRCRGGQSGKGCKQAPLANALTGPLSCRNDTRRNSRSGRRSQGGWTQMRNPPAETDTMQAS